MMMKMSPSLTRFVKNQELMRLGYLDSKQYPRLAPVWFVVIDGDYYFGTATSSPKMKAIRRNPRVGWVIDGGEKGKYKGASMVGDARQVRERALRAKIHRALGAKYFGSPTHSGFIEIYGEPDDPETAYLRLRAKDGISWEY
jgi:general stress protein 26